ncbi:helix-turn-helix transcriptional regulator [Aphanizomenon flos-aquae NRERC-008]|jgi:transcriptional regulator with XRE-family HTH domain|uniref:Helix-turn-helix transcriptional regulator n=2 Tax=Aphanizomenonaceae TaxID=1892259 RepID=A0ACC5Q182_DOLFA|nr:MULTISPECIES: helix-turn-helix transcriptional regulator [Aphanizomenonaceae]MCE2906533.1 helix-turn-helix domain-containing protein [Anabaena sp. CoA2_C59]MDJ0506488.1 helix-turn-helix transcriptional regulator [Nostocales cyanobacterium LE14-WE12]MBD2389067.1 helix-turn-helix transcriptional regulator [Aphanizomenon flos-aquae FACHB-1171]MBD2556724.1 helix-turn-helix transcriptional regulator [Aphanizomenon flos-aquae FACHB-1290]MBD2630080.1 helix-turn-helix transcriptional regulator [Aph
MDNQARKKLGSNIKQLRTKLELSQEQLAEKADLHRTYVGAVERGERNISLDNILAIARALEISASELLEGVE